MDWGGIILSPIILSLCYDLLLNNGPNHFNNMMPVQSPCYQVLQTMIDEG